MRNQTSSDRRHGRAELLRLQHQRECFCQQSGIVRVGITVGFTQLPEGGGGVLSYHSCPDLSALPNKKQLLRSDGERAELIDARMNERYQGSPEIQR